MPDTNYEDLRLILYKETLRRTWRYLRDMKDHPSELEDIHSRSRAAFCALYQVVEQAGLEDDYQAWKQVILAGRKITEIEDIIPVIDAVYSVVSDDG